MEGFVKPMAWNFRYQFPNFFIRSFMYGVVGSLAMFITSWEQAGKMRDKFAESNREYGDSYDFIIVGAGTSGSLLANRLSKEYKVLLLEAGGEPHPFQSIPFMANFMGGYNELDWGHQTVPQKHAFYGSHENRAKISSGKGVGGSSNLDFMMYARGHVRDYENWSQLLGDASWSYERIMNYFMKHEKYEGPWKGKHGKKKMHGDSGEMLLTTPPYSSLAKKFVVAGNELGYPYVDINADYEQGFDMFSHPGRMGVRQTAYKAFLKGQGQRGWNLVVHKYAHVNKILMRGENFEAYAVVYDRHGKSRTATANKEVILCAGAIQSPKLLLLSGIGPANELQSIGIPAVLHLPSVGSGLQDQVSVYLGPFFTSEGHTLMMDRDLSAMSFVSYTMGVGPLTTTGYEAAGMLSSTTSVHSQSHWPDTQLTMYSVGLHSTAAEDFCHAHNLQASIVEDYYSGGKGKDAFFIVVTATRPKSKGTVRLSDTDPYSPVLVDPNYLENLDDVRVMVDGIKKALRMVENTITLKEIGAQFTNRSVSGCSAYKFKSDEYWACYVRLMTISKGHVAGSVGMGRALDNEFRVLGTSKLRVIDAASMPEIVGAPPSAAVMMMAERGAELILKTWRNSDDKAAKLKKESLGIREILRGSAQKLRAMDSSTLFLNAIKDTPSYKELSDQDLKGAAATTNDLRTVSGWANMFRPFHNMMNFWGDMNSIRLLDPNFNTKTTATTAKDKPNPFKLMRAMFRNSLMNAGNEAVVKSVKQVEQNPPKTFVYNTLSTGLSVPEPYVLKPQAIKPSFEQISYPSSSTQGPTNVENLFETNYKATLPTAEPELPKPYVLKPQTNFGDFSTSKPLNYFGYHPVPSSVKSGGRYFSKSLPILSSESRDQTPEASSPLEDHVAKFVRQSPLEVKPLKAVLGLGSSIFKEKKPIIPELEPKDYELMESNDHNETVTPTSAMPMPVEEDLKIIYEPPQINFKNKNSPDLASNVQDILAKAKPHPLIIPHQSSQKFKAASYSFENDPKDLEEEVEKLLKSYKHVPQTEILPKFTKEVYHKHSVPFTKVIHGILEEHRNLNFKLKLPEKVSENAEVENVSKSKGGRDFKSLWPTESPKDGASFRIKILNQ